MKMRMSKKLALEIVSAHDCGISPFAAWLHSASRKSYSQNCEVLAKVILAEARRVLAEGRKK